MYNRGFTKFTIIPSIVSAIAGYILLYTLFKGLTVCDTHVSSSPPPEESAQLDALQLSNLPKINPMTSSDSPGALAFPKSLFSWIPRANYIPDKLNQPIVNPRSVLVDPQGAFFHGSLMITTLLLLVGITFIKNASVWHVTMPAGILALIRDILWDIRSQTRKSNLAEAHELERNAGQGPSKVDHPLEVDALMEKVKDPPLEISELRRPTPLHLAGNDIQTIDQPIQTQLQESATCSVSV
jgi:hypothetical protein